VLAALLVAGDQPSCLLLTVASVGNVAGSVVTWMLAGASLGFWRRRWLPVSEGTLARAAGWYRR
jgi:membrane protein YqaA with SNARE-associated domain